MKLQNSIPIDDKYLWTFDDGNCAENKTYIKTYHQILPECLPYHIHDFYEINIIYEGEGSHYISERIIPAKKGDIFIIPPGIEHGYLAQERLNVYHILLSNRFMFEFSGYLEQLSGYKMLFDIEPILRSRIDTPFYIQQNTKSFTETKRYINDFENEKNDEIAKVFHFLSFLTRLTNKMSRMKSVNTESLTDNQILTILESIEYIENNYSKKLNFKEIAKECALSYNTYLRLFKKMAGSTPAEYLNKCRIRNSAELLRNTNETVMSIALSCGFFDSSHFIRSFIKEMGISPSEFRKKA